MADSARPAKTVAVIGAGWAGLAAAVRAVQAGHLVTVFEASRTLGGRARSVEVSLPNGEHVMLDNGQHVLLGAYSETLALMQFVGVDLDAVLTRLPVRIGLLQTQHWSLFDYLSLVRVVSGWCLQGFSCPEGITVAALCKHASPRLMADVFESLCLSALNTSPAEASGRVFLRVLRDSFFGKSFAYAGSAYKSSDMLIPKMDLGRAFPELAGRWLESNAATVRLGERATSLLLNQNQCRVNDAMFDELIVATPPWEAARLLRDVAPEWAATVDVLNYRAIATVYAQAPAGFDLKHPLRALPCDAKNPAQFVFQRAEAKGLLAFVVSDSQGERETIERWVLAQGEAALGVALQPVTTIIDKRATFACTPHMKRPAKLALAGLTVVGDYLAGPYPATIEGAVLSSLNRSP